MTQQQTVDRPIVRDAMPRMAHIEDPGRPGVSLCGVRLGRSASPARGRCVVCADLSRRSFVAR